MSWLPEDFVHPEHVELPTGHHLRPIRESDVDIDYPAVMGSRESLWARFGAMWGWPPEGMTYEADRQDLARHEAEISAHVTFNYAVLNDDETELLGCVYIDPPGARTPEGADALVSWWVVDSERGGDLERSLNTLVPSWLADRWGFHAVQYAPDRQHTACGNDLTSLCEERDGTVISSSRGLRVLVQRKLHRCGKRARGLDRPGVSAHNLMRAVSRIQARAGTDRRSG